MCLVYCCDCTWTCCTGDTKSSLEVMVLLAVTSSAVVLQAYLWASSCSTILTCSLYLCWFFDATQARIQGHHCWSPCAEPAMPLPPSVLGQQDTQC
jgi:hypothetical protein